MHPDIFALIKTYMFFNKVPYVHVFMCPKASLQSCLTPSFHGNDSPCCTWPTYVSYELKHQKTICLQDWTHTHTCTIPYSRTPSFTSD